MQGGAFHISRDKLQTLRESFTNVISRTMQVKLLFHLIYSNFVIYWREINLFNDLEWWINNLSSMNVINKSIS